MLGKLYFSSSLYSAKLLRQALCAAVLAVLLSVPTYATNRPITFGGTGSDGSTTISGNTTETAPFAKNFVNYTLNSSVTHTVKSGTVLKAIGAVNINGALVVATASPGGSGNTAAGQDGSGPSPGQGGNAQACAQFPGTNQGTGGGGGGGCGGAGGSGGGTADTTHIWGAGSGGPALAVRPGLAGSGGGGAGSVQSSGVYGTASGIGGAGGGSFNVLANGTITISGTGSVAANGGAGLGSQGGNTGSGGGAGSGGVLGFYSLTSTVFNGACAANGGAGAAGSGAITNGGGGGGGGIVVRMSPSNTGSVAPTATGGAAGGGAGSPTAGADGLVLTITQKPSYPTLTCHGQKGGLLVAVAATQAAVQNRAEINWNEGTHNSLLAATMDGSYADNLAYLREEKRGEAVVYVGDFDQAEALKCAS